MFLVSLNSSAIFLSMIFGIFGKFGIEIGDRDFFSDFFFDRNFFHRKKKSKFLVETKSENFPMKKSMKNENFKILIFSIFSRILKFYFFIDFFIQNF